MKTMKQAVIYAVEHMSAPAAGRVADICRFKGMTYLETYEWVCSIVPISLAAWDQLLYAADTLYNG
jgi:hypothetical protein